MTRRESWLARVDYTGVPLLIARLALGGMLVVMGVAKLLDDPVVFLKLIRQYHALPESPAYYMNAVAVAVPWMETICGSALLLGVGVRGAAIIAALMLAFFTPMVFIRGFELYDSGHGQFATFCAVNFDCGCGLGEVFVCNKLAENGALLLAALIAAFSRSRRFCLSTLLTRGGGSSNRGGGPRISVE